MSQAQGPFVGSIQTVEDGWIDYNGHLNMAYYVVIFDRNSDECFPHVGLGPEYIKRSGSTMYTLESHVTYIRELHAGEKVKVTCQFLDYDAKRVHYVQEMIHAEEGWVAAVMESIVMHIDMSTKRSSVMPPDVLERVKAMTEAHKGLPVPSQVGHRIAIPRKA
ncbi:MAG: thioesterase family protein [Hyphomicrobiales bacterium]